MPSLVTQQAQTFELKSIPVRSGLGLKPQHFSEIFDSLPDIGWFEVHPENYMMAGGPMLHYLEKIREHYPLSFHSIGLSLGSVTGVNEQHILKLKALNKRFQPDFFSDHLSWSRWQQTSLNDLLPMPYTQEALAVMINNLDKVQNLLGRKIAVENPSSYFDLSHADMGEAEFLLHLVKATGASILLDINNIFVSARNHGWSATDYIKQIPGHLVTEIHLAGHAIQDTQFGELRIDDHGSPVCKEVWELYAFALSHLGKRPSLIEWDTDVPEFSVLREQASLAEKILHADQTVGVASCD